jgi:hypothetical protein
LEPPCKARPFYCLGKKFHVRALIDFVDRYRSLPQMELSDNSG